MSGIDYLREFQAAFILGKLMRESAKVGKHGTAVAVQVEKYTPERKAEFLLSNATSRADYQRARKAVRKLGIDPDSVPHQRPA